MNETIKRSEISEELYWSFECPKCKSCSDIYEDPDYEETVVCENCHVEFDMEV